MAQVRIQYQCGGVHLPDLGLWFDPVRCQTGLERVFVSHAHSDHIAAHREVILTSATSHFVRHRLKGERIEHVLSFGQAVSFSHGGNSYQAVLHPAGHILGSAMAWIESAGQTVLFTGDFKLDAGLAAEPCCPPAADILIMETTFGRPQYRFPTRAQVWTDILSFCTQALADGATPVLLAYTLGKSQELLTGLRQAKFPIVLHPTIHKNARVYEFLGHQFPPYQKLSESAVPGCVVIWPPGRGRAQLRAMFGNVRLAVTTGWAIDSRCRYRYGVDAAFPLSDHADFDELIEIVRRVNPKRVYTLHGFAADFAQSLREMGIDAQALSQEEQLTLPLFSPRAVTEPVEVASAR